MTMNVTQLVLGFRNTIVKNVTEPLPLCHFILNVTFFSSQECVGLEEVK